jgi:hypothetical protein
MPNLEPLRWTIAAIVLLLILGTVIEIYLAVKGIPELKRIWRSLKGRQN